MFSGMERLSYNLTARQNLYKGASSSGPHISKPGTLMEGPRLTMPPAALLMPWAAGCFQLSRSGTNPVRLLFVLGLLPGEAVTTLPQTGPELLPQGLTFCSGSSAWRAQLLTKAQACVIRDPWSFTRQAQNTFLLTHPGESAEHLTI